MSETSTEARGERFNRSRVLWQELIEKSGTCSASVYTNLGNAALQAQQLGQAILAYRRALAIEPGDARARQNLAYARKLLPDWVPRDLGDDGWASLLGGATRWSSASRSFVAALCFAAASGLVGLSIFTRWVWPRVMAIGPGMIWTVLMGVAVWEHAGDRIPTGVVTTDGVMARAADSSKAPPRLAQPLPAGTEVRIIEDRGRWVRIRLTDGRDAWVKASTVTPVLIEGSS